MNIQPAYPVPPLRRSRIPLAWTLAGAIALMACGGHKEVPPPTVPVVVAEVEARPVPLLVEAVGTVEPIESASVKSQLSGVISRVGFSEGDEVKAGQLLFQLDPRPFRATLDQARAQLERDRVQALNAKVQAGRYRELVAKDYVAKEQADAAQTQADALAAAAKADEAVVERARLDLSYASITAPFSGRAGAILLKLGNVVKANDVPMVVIHQIRPIRVAFAVPAQRLPDIRKYGSRGDLEVLVHPSRDEEGPELKGRLAFVDNAVDPGTGTLTLKAEFGNEEGLLWPGQFVDARLVLAVEPDAIVVPQAAVVTGQDGTFVFLVKGDGTAERKLVEVDRSVDGMVVLKGGLVAGQTVVTDGQVRLVPGAKVEVVR